MNRRRLAAYLTAAVAGLSARMGLARPDEGHYCLINGVRVPWPDDGLTIEVRPTADGRPYGPLKLHVRRGDRPVVIVAREQGAITIEADPPDGGIWNVADRPTLVLDGNPDGSPGAVALDILIPSR